MSSSPERCNPTGEWAPGIYVDRAPGKTSVQLAKASLAAFLGASILLPLYGYMGLNALLVEVQGLLLSVTIALFGVFFVAGYRSWAREKLEAQMGYTLSGAGDRDLAQLDSESGFVIRLVGEDDLEREEWIRRRDLLRNFGGPAIDGDDPAES